MFSMRLIGCGLAAWSACSSASDYVRIPDPAESVVIIATRMPQQAAMLPISADLIDGDRIQRGQLRINLSESLGLVPGIVAQNRQNYAQDLQISSRGFGARSTFGVRGLRLYSDGIPATMPDGQGQVSHFDLGSAKRIEVMRGPFSALYGNSSGGVIALYSEDGLPGTAIDADAAAGAYGTWRSGIKISGDSGRINYVLNATRFESDGYRNHSAVRRESLNAKLAVGLHDGTNLTLVANSIDMPEAEDPLGLTRAQFSEDPRQAGSNSLGFDTRKSVRQEQLGLALRRKLDSENELNAELYGGQRSTRQFQAIPTASQLAATSPGGVIDLERAYWGGDLRWVHQGSLLSTPASLVIGINYENLDEGRRGFQNFLGSKLGVIGALRRNEKNAVHNFDQYLQLQWRPTEAWTLQAGVRHSAVRVRSRDLYVVPGNGDDSGSTGYAATTPVFGVSWKAAENVRVYGALGRGFETPTFNEISYRSVSGAATGLNLGLHPSRSNHFEVGIKLKPLVGARLDAALFCVNTSDELAVLQNSGGRSVFQNVGSTRRRGFELSYSQRWHYGVSTDLAYTLLDASYGTDYLSCGAPPCTVPATRVAAGSRLPGIPRSSLYGELAWRPNSEAMSVALEVRSVGRVYVNDANSDTAEAYATANLRLEFQQKFSGWRLRESLRIDNLADRRYAGSIIVNEANLRYFEPAPGRSVTVGVSMHVNW